MKLRFCRVFGMELNWGANGRTNLVRSCLLGPPVIEPGTRVPWPDRWPGYGPQAAPTPTTERINGPLSFPGVVLDARFLPAVVTVMVGRNRGNRRGGRERQRTEKRRKWHLKTPLPYAICGAHSIISSHIIYTVMIYIDSLKCTSLLFFSDFCEMTSFLPSFFVRVCSCCSLDKL